MFPWEHMRKVGSKNRLRKVGPKRWAEGQQVMGFDATEAKFRLSEKWSDAERNKKQEETKICKGRSRGLRSHASGLRGWTFPQQHSSLQCSTLLSGSTQTPQLQQKAGTLGTEISSFLSSQGNILNHPKDFWTGVRKDGKPTREPSWRVTFYFW